MRSAPADTKPLDGVRLAVVVNSFPAVSETFIFNKVMALRAAGLDVTVVCNSLANDSPLFTDRLNGQSLNFVRMAPLALPRPQRETALVRVVARQPAPVAQLWKRASALYGQTPRALRACVMAVPFVVNGYDIIHFEYSGLAVEYLDVLPLLQPTKFLMSCRGAAEQITPLVEPARAEKLRAVLPYMDCVHCVSADMVRTMQQYGLEDRQVFINHPSIDVERFRRRRPYPRNTQGPYCLLSTARLHWKKGLEYALLAVRRLLDQGYLIRYDILGSGSDEERLRFAIHDLELGDYVRLLGSQPAECVWGALESADLYVQPSLSEGLSNAVLEAMAMEVPVVTTGAGGMAEAVRDGRDGFVAPSRDPVAMANRIASLLDDLLLREAIGRRARERVEKAFTLNAQTQRFIHRYQELLGSR